MDEDTEIAEELSMDDPLCECDIPTHSDSFNEDETCVLCEDCNGWIVIGYSRLTEIERLNDLDEDEESDPAIMPRAKKITTCDCETDPFLHGRIPKPFIWGYYDGRDFLTFDRTEDFVAHVIDKPIICYAHNGGKFDFMFLLTFVKETKAQIIGGRIVSMMLGQCELRDSFAAVPQALGTIKKKEIEYWKLEAEHRVTHRAEIIDYLEGDCVYLFELMDSYNREAGRRKTIASNALAFCKKLGTNPGQTNHRFDTNYRPFYFGGRTECFNPGTHRNIKILDIRSAYPYAMTHDHATGSEFNRRDDLMGLTREQIQRSFIVLECNGNGCFPLRTKGAQGLHFPKEYNQFHVTGWEYVAAKDLGLIDDEKIIEVRYSNETINFKKYVDHWFKYKEAHPKKTDIIGYTIGKIMMNSLYGKLAQNPARYYDYVICMGGTEVDHKQGWTLYTEFEGHEIHRRESLWKYKFEYGVEWEARNLYKNVATGASITGFTRAHLLRAMHTIGAHHVIYTDTDSIVCGAGADVSLLPIGPDLGMWEIEEINAPVGHFNGKKLYGIELSGGAVCNCGKPGGCKLHKIASKGAKLTFRDMEEIAAGKTITYRSEAPSFSLANGTDFIVRNIRSTATLKKETQ